MKRGLREQARRRASASSVRRSQATNAASSSGRDGEAGERARARPAVAGRLDDRVDQQPPSRLSRARSPGRSSARRAAGRARSARRARRAARPSAATGVIAKKMLDHEKRSSSQPPTIGPSAIAIPAVAPHRPIARARSRALGEDVGDQRQRRREDHRRAEPHHRSAPRSAAPELVDQPAGGARRPEQSEPAEQHALAPEAVARALPAASSSAAKTRLYASTIHCSWLLEACSSRTSVGSATLTIVVSRLIAKAASSSDGEDQGAVRACGSSFYRKALRQENQVLAQISPSSMR